MISKHLKEIQNVLGTLLSKRYENMLLMVDYIVEPNANSMQLTTSIIYLQKN